MGEYKTERDTVPRVRDSSGNCDQDPLSAKVNDPTCLKPHLTTTLSSL